MRKVLMAALLLMGAAFYAHAQEYWEEGYEGFPVQFSGQRPVISDFVSAILTQEDLGEALGGMKVYWKMHLQGQALPEGHSFLVDTKNGYVCYDESYMEDDGTVYSQRIEFCFWNCSDGKHKLVAENIIDYRNGKPFMGQYSGLGLYMYDGGKKKMNWAYASDVGLDLDPVMPEDVNLYYLSLPRTGKTIHYWFVAPSGNKEADFTWNGKQFVQD